MAISLASLGRHALTPPRILVHGVAGVGKTTFAASAESPVVSPTEDGLGMIKVPHFPLARSFDEVMEALAALYSEPHEFQDRGGRQPRLAGAAGLAARLQGQRLGARSRSRATARAISPRSTSGGSISTG